MGIETPKGFIDIEGFVVKGKDLFYPIRATINIAHIISAAKITRDGKEKTMIILTDGRHIDINRTYEVFIKDMIHVQ